MKFRYMVLMLVGVYLTVCGVIAHVEQRDYLEVTFGIGEAEQTCPWSKSPTPATPEEIREGEQRQKEREEWDELESRDYSDLIPPQPIIIADDDSTPMVPDFSDGDPGIAGQVEASEQPAESPSDVVKPEIYNVKIGVEGDGSGGSGTQFYADGTNAYFATCGHLFDDSRKGISIAYPNGVEVPAVLLDYDTAQDLATLKTKDLGYEYLPVSASKDYSRLTVSGYGERHNFFRSVTGDFIRWTNKGREVRPLKTTVAFRARMRSGDSGGGITNGGPLGGLYGSLWGCVFDDKLKQWECYGTAGKGFRDFVAGTLRKHAKANRLVVVSMPDEQCAPCKALRPIIESLAAEGYDAVDLQRTEYDGTDAGPMYPTLLFFCDDLLVSKTTGFVDAVKLRNALTKAD